MIFNDRNIQVREYPVNKDFGEDEPFFRIQTEAGEVQLPKLLFQQTQPLPDTLSCRIKGYNGALPVLSHNMPKYVSDFYADGFSKGQEFEFEVVSTHDLSKGFYRLADSNGLYFKLHEPKTVLVKGQKVKCKFEILEQNKFSLRRSNSDILYPMLRLSDIARKALVHGVNAAKLENTLQQIPEMNDALDELNHGRPVWILTAMRTLRQIMPRLFNQSLETYSHEIILTAINGYERVLMDLLQGSGFLKNLKGAERTQLQAEFTAEIEKLDIYRKTLEILAKGEQRKFIDSLLHNLKESGYLYHPTTQFSIMMILFRLSPELVNSSLGNIFDTLMGWDLQTWKTEPFRQAFVEQLEIYIKDTREEIDSFLQAETPDDSEKIERVLTAIAIQQSLASNSDIIDTQLNTSLFYRYLSALRRGKSDVLLEKSYLSILDVPLPTDYTWSDIKEPTMMMTRATVDPPVIAREPIQPKYYSSDNIDIEINTTSISITKNNDDPIEQIKNQMFTWPEVSLKVGLDKSMSHAKMKSVEGHAEFWTNIENALFMPDTQAVEQQSTKRKPDFDDYVRVQVEKIIHNATNPNKIEAFECRIVDDNFMEGKAILPADHIVNYNLRDVTLGTFRHDDGSHMYFEAKVEDIDENDIPILSLEDAVYDAIRDMANVNEECYCVITKDNGRSYSALSEKGFGLFVNKNDPTMPTLRNGTVIKVVVTGYNHDAIQGSIVEGPIDSFFFSNAKAFRYLLGVIAEKNQDTDNDETSYDDEDRISPDIVKEIIEIFRFKALSVHHNILAAFDYLSLARIMALVIKDEVLAETIKAQKQILLLHNKYAKNKKLYHEDIEAIADIGIDSEYIHRVLQKLYIVASLDQSEKNNMLWDILNNSPFEAERELAQMVLSYNMLYELNREDKTVLTIKDKIAEKLNVTDEQHDLKYYGSESQYVEFKSSMVYPAVKGKKGISMADPDKQEHEILHIIAGFLNTEGGTLYIGVGDDRYERGLEDDFTYYKSLTPDQNSRFRRSIKTLDNAANYLQNLIDSSFNLGKNVGEYAKAYIDDESTKGVIAVKIIPCPHIIYLDNVLYTRHSSKTEPLIKKEEIDFFISNRKQLYEQITRTSESEAPQIEPVKPKTQVVETKQKETAIETASHTTYTFPVATSLTRHNVLHEYDNPEHFVTPIAYLRFVGDNGYVITDDEWSIDTDKDRLDLVITDDDADDYLILVYEGDYAVKVKIRELLDKNRNVHHSHYGERKLVFASIIKNNGGLYSMHTSAKNSTIYERVTPADKIMQGSINSTPEHLIDTDNVVTLLYETILPAKMPVFNDVLSTNMKRNQLGALVKGIGSVKTSADDAKAILLNKLN